MYQYIPYGLPNGTPNAFYDHSYITCHRCGNSYNAGTMDLGCPNCFQIDMDIKGNQLKLEVFNELEDKVEVLEEALEESERELMQTRETLNTVLEMVKLLTEPKKDSEQLMLPFG